MVAIGCGQPNHGRDFCNALPEQYRLWRQGIPTQKTSGMTARSFNAPALLASSELGVSPSASPAAALTFGRDIEIVPGEQMAVFALILFWTPPELALLLIFL